jgi:steroid Delta-isomerase
VSGAPDHGAANAAARHGDARIARVVAFFEQLAPDDLARLAAIYTEDARFKDPFNDVAGQAALRAVFEHMFRTLEAPRFVVREIVADGDRCFLTWDFLFRFRRFDTRIEQRVHGGSHLVFAPDGRVRSHRDYWDAAEELYEKLPVVGALMRWLKRRANA